MTEERMKWLVDKTTINMQHNYYFATGCAGIAGNEILQLARAVAAEAREEGIGEIRAGIECVEALIDNSEGVAGLHLNGDIAPWDELRTGGVYYEWLVEFDRAAVRLKEKGK